MVQKSIGIIGCGIIADTHVEAIKKALPNATILVCDPLPGKAELLRKKYDLKSSFYTIEEMLSQENLFAVHILTPPQFHVEQALLCIAAGCHVLIEKPLALRSKDVDTLYEGARRHNKVVCVDHSLFYQPSILKMLQKIRSTTDNEVLFVNSFFGLDLGGLPYSRYLPQKHWKRGIPGGALVDTIIHPIALAVELTGKPLSIDSHLIGTNTNGEDLHISWQSETAIASITVSSRAQPFRRVSEVTTNKQSFVVDHSTETLVSLDSGFGPKSLRKLLRNFGYGTQLMLGTVGTVIQVLRGKLKENPGARGLVEAFYRHLIDGEEIPVSEENARNSVSVLEQIITSLSRTEKQEISAIPEDDAEKTEHNLSVNPTIRTVVTGASGFLGSIICESLVKKGREVIAQVRRGANADKLQSPPIKKIYEDFNYEPVDYDYLVEGAKEVIHCAHAAGARTWEQFKQTNVDATLALYDAAAKAGCEKFIFISSVAVYGVHQRGHISVNEETPVTLGNSKWDFYILSKALAEKMLLEKAKNGGPKLLIIRPGIFYAADGTKLARRSVPLKDSRLVITFGNGQNHSPFNRVDVLAEAIVNALDLTPFREGVYNMTGNPEESSREFIYNRMKKLGVTCRFLTLPAFPFRLIASSLEFFHNISFRKSPPKLTRYIIDSSTRDIYYDCLKAEKELGWDSQKAIDI